MKKKPSTRGRPSQGRKEYLEVRLTEPEKKAFQMAAEESGVSLSDWVRINLRACTASQLGDKAPLPGSFFKMTAKTDG